MSVPGPGSAEAVVVAAPAKLNLTLRVLPARADGYHDLESLMVEVGDLADTVEVRRSEARSVSCDGLEETFPQEQNLAWRALDALEEEAGWPLPAIAVHITKHIPTQAGLGGGSSDAAATMVATDRLLGLRLGPNRLERAAAGVGSDVPFFVRGGCQWARGRGELLSPGRCPELLVAIVVPPITLSTGRVYRAFDRMRPPPPPGDAAGAGWLRNDLWPPALAEAPGLGALARALRANGASATLLCGSGAGMAGIFEDRAAAVRAAADLRRGARLATVVRIPAVQ